MGVQGVSISQNSSCKSLNIIHLTAIMQYKWDHPLKLKHLHHFVGAFLFASTPLLCRLVLANYGTSRNFTLYYWIP